MTSNINLNKRCRINSDSHDSKDLDSNVEETNLEHSDPNNEEINPYCKWINPILGFHDTYVSAEVERIRNVFLRPNDHSKHFEFIKYLNWAHQVNIVFIGQYFEKYPLPIHIFTTKILPQLCDLGIRPASSPYLLDITLYKANKYIKDDSIFNPTLFDQMQSKVNEGELKLSNAGFFEYTKHIKGDSDEQLQHCKTLLNSLGLLLTKEDRQVILSWKTYGLYSPV